MKFILNIEIDSAKSANFSHFKKAKNAALLGLEHFFNAFFSLKFAVASPYFNIFKGKK